MCVHAAYSTISWGTGVREKSYPEFRRTHSPCLDLINMLCAAYLTRSWGFEQVDEYVTHKLKLKDINEAFDLLHAGKALRVVMYTE